MAALSSIPISTLPLFTKSNNPCFSHIFPTQFLRIPDSLTISYQRRKSWIIGSVAEELESKGQEIVSPFDGFEEHSSSSAPVEENGDAFDGLNSRTINAAIVLGFGTFIVTKLLTIDRDYWHGWTLYEVLRYVPEHNWIAYEEALRTNPVLAKMVISGVVYSLGDWIAQCYEGKPLFEFDRTRVFRSGLVGFILHGSLSHYYYQFCEALIPFKDWWGVPAKVVFDQTFWSAIWNSIYFVVLGFLRSKSLANSFSKLKPTFWSMLTGGNFGHLPISLPMA